MERDVNVKGEHRMGENFNSHAHVERDAKTILKRITSVISTHTLTWSVTPSSFGLWEQQLISTHTLTWSVTWYFCPILCCKKFQLTRSRGAWLTPTYLKVKYLDFNSHAHVERDDKAADFIVEERKFQLTRSRGAWPQRHLLESYLERFQLTRSRGAWQVIHKYWQKPS